jgi:2-dehydro-3-deoxyphosphogluconate aldolase/(4S)-4-hydroxy-2-oxoglutarate aldolase
VKLTTPVVGILRGVEGSFFREVMYASFSSGLQALEITMNTVGALEILSSCRHEVPGGKWLGMGTIRNLEEARKAVGAGAMFLVTPNTDTAVIDYGVRQGVPVIAGAFTPTEVYSAWSAGAIMVKVFPCDPVGPAYIRELKGPFDQIPLLAVGGVCKENLGDYFKAGASGVGVSSSLFGSEAIAKKDSAWAGENVRSFVLALGDCISG